MTITDNLKSIIIDEISEWSNEQLVDSLESLDSYKTFIPPPPLQIEGCLPRMSSAKRVFRFTPSEKKAIKAEISRRLLDAS